MESKYRLVFVHHESALTKHEMERLPWLMRHETMLHHGHFTLLDDMECQVVFLFDMRSSRKEMAIAKTLDGITRR